DADYNGNDSFEFTASDGEFNSASASIDISVTPVNDEPEALPASSAVAEDCSRSISLRGSDIDSDSLSFAITRQPANGTLTGSPPNVSYEPAANFNGTDSFQFTASDGRLTSTPATVSINVTPINDPPLSRNGIISVAADTPVTFTPGTEDVDG